MRFWKDFWVEDKTLEEGSIKPFFLSFSFSFFNAKESIKSLMKIQMYWARSPIEGLTGHQTMQKRLSTNYALAHHKKEHTKNNPNFFNDLEITFM